MPHGPICLTRHLGYAESTAPVMNPEHLELLKAFLNLVVSTTTLALGWLVGLRLSAYWNLKQKQRELDLASANEFHKLYGEFFAIWKLWNFAIRQAPEVSSVDRSKIFERACAAEGQVESLFVRLASTRNLTEEQTAMLGRFRQGYQSLRQAIRDGRLIAWHSSSHPEYVAFKTLATQVAVFIAGAGVHHLQRDARAAALLKVTSNEWEGKWHS